MKKFLATVLLLAAAGTGAFYLKDYMDSEAPEFAVPQIEVTADIQVLPHTLAGYDWRFYNGRTSSVAVEPYYVWYENYAAPPTELKGGEALSIRFTTPPRQVTVRRKDADSYQAAVDDTETKVPTAAGIYVYEVRATFERGWVVYYFKLMVNDAVF